MTDHATDHATNLAGLRPDGLYHLSTAAEWAASQAAGEIRAESLETEGFVHCSWGRQLPGTIAKHFEGVTGLLALELDPGALGEVELVEEDSYGSGQAYPHAYGPISTAAVTGTVLVA